MSATPPRVDLSSEAVEARSLVSDAVRDSVGPELERAAQESWPRDTGRSAEAWRFDGRALVNPEPYAEFVRHAGGLALDTVLDPALMAVTARTHSTS